MCIRRNQVKVSLMVLLSLFLLLSACSKGGNAGQDDQTKNSDSVVPIDSKEAMKIIEYKGGPVELLVLDHNTGTTDEHFERFFAEPIRAKYPQIKLVQTRDPLDKLISTGTYPDMVLVSNPALAVMLEADLPEDLTAMIKEYNIDLAQMNPTVVEQMQKLGEQKSFYGIPFAMNYGAMVHNRNIFDKFGYDYPKDVMSYDELLELGRKLTRPDSGIDYIGVMPPDLRQLYWQGALPVFDKTTNKASFTSDQHVKVFTMLKDFYSVPGYMNGSTYSHNVDVFFKEQRMAMYPNWISAMIIFFDRAGTKDEFAWDITAHPTYAAHPTSGKEVDFHMAVVNKASKNREAAYQVLVSLISEDVQTMLSKAGRLTVLNDSQIQQVYGEDSNIFAGKNLASIFKVTPSPLPEASIYDPKINALLIGEVVKHVMVEGKDMNTALREGEEKATKEIVEAAQAANAR